MKRYLLGTLVMTCLIGLAGMALGQCPETTIDPIQVYDPTTGAANSPCAGQVATLKGRITALKGTYNNGTHYLQDATGGIAFYAPGAPALVLGDSVEISGPVSTFSGEIQLQEPTVTPSGALPVLVQPIDVAITDLVNIPEDDPPYTYPFDYEYVGTLIACTGQVAATDGSYNFYLHDGSGDTIQVYIDSDTGIDISGVDVGETWKVIAPCVNFNGLVELKPRYQTDVIDQTLPPQISNIQCDNWAPKSTDPVTVTATVTDENPAKGLANVSLYYRETGEDSIGVFSPIAMVNTGGDTYSATIPAPHVGVYLHFYVQATDDDIPVHTVTNPGAAPAEFYELAIGTTSIYQVEWVDPASDFQGSPLFGKTRNIEGIIIAGTGDVGALSQYNVQEADPYDPAQHGAGVGEVGTYKWSGVRIYEGTAGNFLARGDRVRIGGEVSEYYGLTEIEPHRAAAVYLLSFGNELPPATYAGTRDLADNNIVDGNGELGEAYESVWVRTKASCIVDTLGYGEYIISDTCVRADSVEVDPTATLVYQPIIDDVVIVEGFMDYEFGAFQVSPISDDFVVSGLTGIEFPDQPLPVVLRAGGFKSIQPNPFNPKTEIRFQLNRDNLTQLNIYNIRGQLVSTLVNDRLPAMEHVYVWDGTDDSGMRVSSGTYFARLRIGTEVMQVQKLTVVK